MVVDIMLTDIVCSSDLKFKAWVLYFCMTFDLKGQKEVCFSVNILAKLLPPPSLRCNCGLSPERYVLSFPLFCGR